jgi:O-antigen/teichoic acid export membrane protein
MLAKFLKNTAIYGLAPQINLIASFIALPFITKYYNDVDFGVQATLLAYIGAFSAFSLLGLKLILTNTFFKHKSTYEVLWRQIYGFLIFWNIIYSIIVGVVLYFIMPVEVVENKIVIIFLGLLPTSLFSITKLIGNSFLQFNEQPKGVTIRGDKIALKFMNITAQFILLM